jgi:hypothetical protein
LRRRWDALCDDTAALVAHARDRAAYGGDATLCSFLEQQDAALRALKASADGRRFVPGQVASGLLHDAPPQLAEPAYKDAYTALRRVADAWSGGLGAPGWNWSERGYPPGWSAGLGDRLRAGVFYRAR